MSIFFWLTIKKCPSCKVLIFKIRLTRPYICKIFLFYKYSSVTLYSKYYLFLLDFQCFFQSFLVCVCSIFCLVYALMFMWYLVWVCIVCDLFSALLRFSFFLLLLCVCVYWYDYVWILTCNVWWCYYCLLSFVWCVYFNTSIMLLQVLLECVCAVFVLSVVFVMDVSYLWVYYL